MTSKEYLNQAHQIEKRIMTKAEQIEVLRAVVTKVTTTLSKARVQSTPSPSRMEGTIAKMIDLEEELKADMDELITTKADVTKTVRMVSDPELQLLLEKRYLCHEKWDEIAMDMGISVQHMFRLHGEALKKVEEILKLRVNERD